LVLVSVVLGCAFFLVEAALPTFGVATVAGLGLLGLGVLAAGEQPSPWWPLILVAAALCIWAVLLIAQRPSPAAQAVSASLFGIGSVAYGVLATDPATVAVGVVGSVALPFAFRRLLAASVRLVDAAPQTGMEALIGRPATVVAWTQDHGTVRVDGSLWDARSGAGTPAPVAVNTEVMVTGYNEMTVEVK